MCNATTVAKWLKAQNDLKNDKKLEMALRLKICPDILGDTVKGTVRANKGIYELKAVAKLNYKLDKEQYEFNKSDLTDEELACISFRPTIKQKEFDALPHDSILKRMCVKVSPATPTLELISVAE